MTFAEAKKLTSLIVTPEFRMVFPNLFEPKAFIKNGKAQGDPVYSVLMLFDPKAKGAPNTLNDLRTLALQVATAKFPGRDLKKAVADGTLTWPFKDGNKLAEAASTKQKDGKFYAGMIALRATSKYPPGVVGQDKKAIADPRRVYSGCYAHAELNFVAGEGIGNNADFVKAYVNFIMVTREGERIAGRDAASAFAGISGGVSNEDPTGGDDEIAF